MSTVNIAAITTGSFIGVLGLLAIVVCVGPLTRCVGDACCCPWRMPFTKRKQRRNADEEVGKDELPYVVAPGPWPGLAVAGGGYRRMSPAYMSAASVMDPESAKEETRPTAERHSTDYRLAHGGGGGRGAPVPVVVDARQQHPSNARGSTAYEGSAGHRSSQPARGHDGRRCYGGGQQPMKHHYHDLRELPHSAGARPVPAPPSSASQLTPGGERASAYASLSSSSPYALSAAAEGIYLPEDHHRGAAGYYQQRRLTALQSSPPPEGTGASSAAGYFPNAALERRGEEEEEEEEEIEEDDDSHHPPTDQLLVSRGQLGGLWNEEHWRTTGARL